MKFKIAVLIKQVPDTTDIKWTAENTIQREGLDSIINPFDVGAITLANKIKKILADKNETVEITAVTMGPQQAIDVLYTALALGCDEAVLLSDKRFSGADTLATAYTLAGFIKSKMNDVKLVLCGQQAIDGDTAQTPSSVAQKLGFTQITNVTEVKEVTPDFSIWHKETHSYEQDIKANFPLLVATTLCNLNIECKIDDYIRAQNTEISVFSSDDIQTDSERIGFKGSPTIVKKAFRPDFFRNTEILENCTNEKLAEFIFNEINNCISKK